MGVRKPAGFGRRVKQFVWLCLLCLWSAPMVRAQEVAPQMGEPMAWRKDFAALVDLVRENCRMILHEEGCLPSSPDQPGTAYQLTIVGESGDFRERQVWQEIEALRARIVVGIFNAPAGGYVPEHQTSTYVAALQELDQQSRADDASTRGAVELLAESLMENWLVAYQDRAVRQALFDQDLQQIGGVLGAFLVSPLVSAIAARQPEPGAVGSPTQVAKNLKAANFVVPSSPSWVPGAFHRIRQFWPLRSFSAKLSALSLFVASGVWATQAEAVPGFDCPPSPAHLIHFSYGTRPSYVGDCLHGLARCDESLEDWENRALGSTVSAFAGALIGGTKGISQINALAGQVVAAKRLLQISAQGLLLGFATDWGVYRLWQWRGREESSIKLHAAIRKANLDAQNEVFSEEEWQARMAELYQDLNQLEVTSLAETESNYRFQLKLMNLLFDFEKTQQEGVFPLNLHATVLGLDQLRKEASRISEIFEVEISQVAIDEILKQLKWLECWRASVKKRAGARTTDEVGRQCNPPTLNNGRSRYVWRQAVGKMVAALDADMFNAFSSELVRLTELRERLEKVVQDNSFANSDFPAHGVGQEKAIRLSGLQKMLLTRIEILKEEEVFLKQFIGPNNSEQPQAQNFRERMRKMLLGLGPS